MVYGKMSKLNILYEDNHLIVVEKKPNILSQSDITGDIDLLTLVKEYIKEKYDKPGNVYVGLIHRLDRPVGGILVFAKTSKAAKRLNEQIKNHEFKKGYLAVLEGNLDSSSGMLVNHLYKDKKTGISKVVNDNFIGGKLCKLQYTVLAYLGKRTLVKINLITGRHHQIRLQFSNIGHPLHADRRYGDKTSDGIRLYAYELEFKHPVTKELLSFKILPKWRELENEAIIHRL